MSLSEVTFQSVCLLLIVLACCGLRTEARSAAHRQQALPPFHDPAPPRPEFDPSMPRNVTALTGRDARLVCIVRNLGNYTVSWIRQSDLHILTAGRYTYTTDLRFEAEHRSGSAIWTLSLRGARHNDSGLYDCQISTKPEMVAEVQFNVVDFLPETDEETMNIVSDIEPTEQMPVTRILGASSVFIQRGSDLNLTCTVSYSPEPPTSLVWFHRNQVVSFNSSRGGVSVITARGHTTSSHLLIQSASGGDSGDYICSPNNAEPASVTVHILDGEHPAAMQTGCSSFAGCGRCCLTGLLVLLSTHRLLTAAAS